MWLWKADAEHLSLPYVNSGRQLTCIVVFTDDASPLHVPWRWAVQTIQPLLQRSQDLWILHHLHSQLTSWGHTHTHSQKYNMRAVTYASSQQESLQENTFYCSSQYLQLATAKLSWRIVHTYLSIVCLLYVSRVERFAARSVQSSLSQHVRSMFCLLCHLK